MERYLFAISHIVESRDEGYSGMVKRANINSVESSPYHSVKRVARFYGMILRYKF
jgi:hypothetical protein